MSLCVSCPSQGEVASNRGDNHINILAYHRPLNCDPIQSQTAQVAAYTSSRFGPDAELNIFTETDVFWKVPFTERPAGAQFTAAIRKGDHIVLSSLLSAFNSRPDLLETLKAWASTGLTLHLCDVNGFPVELDPERFSMGVTLMRDVYDAFNSERYQKVSDTQAKLRSEGKRAGGQPPIGFRYHRGKLTAHKSEQQAIAQLLALHESGLSLDRIHMLLLKHRIRNRYGKEWGRTRIDRALKAAKKLRTEGTLPDADMNSPILRSLQRT